MIITMKKDAPEQEIKNLMESIEAKGVKVTMIQGTNYNVFGLVGDTTVIDDRMITANPYVDNVKRIAAPYKKANRLFHPLDSVIDVDGIKVGGKESEIIFWTIIGLFVWKYFGNLHEYRGIFRYDCKII